MKAGATGGECSLFTHRGIALRTSANAGQRERFTSRSPADRGRSGFSSEFDSVENELQAESELLVERNACELVGCSNGGGVGVCVEGTVEVAQLRRLSCRGSRSALLYGESDNVVRDRRVGADSEIERNPQAISTATLRSRLRSAFDPTGTWETSSGSALGWFCKGRRPARDASRAGRSQRLASATERVSDRDCPADGASCRARSRRPGRRAPDLHSRRSGNAARRRCGSRTPHLRPARSFRTSG